jgi:hypothetical protein
VIQEPAIVTDDGNIRIHNQEGARIPLFFEHDDGTPRDMREATVAFLCPTGLRRVLIPGVQNHELILALEPNEFSAHIGRSVKFIVRDESVTERPVIWRGQVFPEGW